MKTTLAFLFTGLCTFLPLRAELIIHDVPDLVTPPVFDPDGEAEPNEFSTVGVFLQFSTGLAIVNNDETAFPELVDGQYQLRMNNAYTITAAQLVIQGLISRGNSVLGKNNVPGTADGNIARLEPGDSLGPSNFIDAVYTDLAGSFGLWNDKGRGQAGVRFVQNDTDFHYGFIDITIQQDNSIVLHGFAYQSTPSTAITAFEIGTGVQPPNTSPWASDEPVYNNWKDTAFGLLDDSNFPWVWHAGFAQWLYVENSAHTETGFLLFPLDINTWLWTHPDIGIWYYNFSAQDWFYIGEPTTTLD